MADYLALCSEIVRDPEQVGAATQETLDGELLFCVSLSDDAGWTALNEDCARALHELLTQMLGR